MFKKELESWTTLQILVFDAMVASFVPSWRSPREDYRIYSCRPNRRVSLRIVFKDRSKHYKHKVMRSPRCAGDSDEEGMSETG